MNHRKKFLHPSRETFRRGAKTRVAGESLSTVCRSRRKTVAANLVSVRIARAERGSADNAGKRSKHRALDLSRYANKSHGAR